MHWYSDLSAVLGVCGIVTGGIMLLDRLQGKVLPEGIISKDSRVLELATFIFPVIMLVFVLRTFIAEPFRIPSGSMKPTLFEGEFILVNKFSYGLRIPVSGKAIIPLGLPKRGDVMVFRPVQDKMGQFMIKRVIGLPGDTVAYKNKLLYINGELQTQQYIEQDFDMDIHGPVWRVERKEESLGESKHPIWVRKGKGFDKAEFVVPEGHYFMMGDNRDNSSDSRVWGVVPEEHIVGKAFLIWMSWDMIKKEGRWSRFFHWIV